MFFPHLSCRSDLVSALEREKPNVNVLLETWQSTTEWESQMARRYNQPVSVLHEAQGGVWNLNICLKQIDQVLGISNATISSALSSHFHIFTEAQDASVGSAITNIMGSNDMRYARFNFPSF
mgnify:CR=1 FL=1